jgi:hypothetical protein
MYDAMRAVSHGAVPEISRGSSVKGEDYTQKRLFPRRAAVRISWLLVLVLRNISTSVTPLDLPYSGGRMAISRLVTEGDCLACEQNLKFVCGLPNFTSSTNGARGPFRLGQTN